jgi:hypothetical protein
MITILRDDDHLNNYVEMYSDSIFRLSVDGQLKVLKAPNIGTLSTVVSLDQRQLLQTLLDGALPTGDFHSDASAK